MKYALKINISFLHWKPLILSCLLMSTILHHCNAGKPECHENKISGIVTYKDKNENEYTFHPIDELYKQYTKQTCMYHEGDVDIILT